MGFRDYILNLNEQSFTLSDRYSNLDSTFIGRQYTSRMIQQSQGIYFHVPFLRPQIQLYTDPPTPDNRMNCPPHAPYIPSL